MVLEKRGQIKQAWQAYTAARDIFAKLGVDSDHQCYRAARRSIASLEKDVELTTTDQLLQAGVSREDNHSTNAGRNGSNHSFTSIEFFEDREASSFMATNNQQSLGYQAAEEEQREIEPTAFFQYV